MLPSRDTERYERIARFELFMLFFFVCIYTHVVSDCSVPNEMWMTSAKLVHEINNDGSETERENIKYDLDRYRSWNCLRNFILVTLFHSPKESVWRTLAVRSNKQIYVVI
jgi:hypothetical protein